MDEFLKAHPSCRSGPDAVRLVLVGGCRTAEDEERVQGLKDLVHELNLEVREYFFFALFVQR